MPAPRPSPLRQPALRRFAPAAAVVAAAGVLTAAVLAGWLAPAVAIAVATALILAAAGGARIGSGRAEHQELLARLDRLDSRVAGLEWMVEDLRPGPGEPAGEVAAVAAHREIYAKQAAHADLLALITPRAAMPPLGGWALDADVLHTVVQLLYQHRPELVVECGSGSSSVWLGYLAERLGTGRIVSLEHDERFLRASRELVRVHALEQIVDLRHAPLQPWTAAGEPFRWYAPVAWESLAGIGLLLVDGPPGATGAQARYPAGPSLFPRCASGALVVLDDVHRADERLVSQRWQAEWPGLTRVPAGPGLAHVLQFARPPAGPGTIGGVPPRGDTFAPKLTSR